MFLQCREMTFERTRFLGKVFTKVSISLLSLPGFVTNLRSTSLFFRGLSINFFCRSVFQSHGFCTRPRQLHPVHETNPFFRLKYTRWFVEHFIYERQVCKGLDAHPAFRSCKRIQVFPPHSYVSKTSNHGAPGDVLGADVLHGIFILKSARDTFSFLFRAARDRLMSTELQKNATSPLIK